jgi:glutathione gamma-glutamylcysteinyltransferase
MAMTKKHFYRKPLPSSCIEFGSDEGKTIFKEALNEGTMDCFFNLAAQFRTQDEPAYCGLSTLVMVLNALSVDPGRVWKGPWRWYHENMLECCVPLEVIKKEGITLFHFSCLAMCNGLNVDLVQALDTATIAEFREVVKRVTKSESQVLVCSYSRAILGQSGDGHFSPIGGYHAGQDLVLIFDVARFKYPPHWVTVDLLWRAMQGLDKETGLWKSYFL